MLLRCVWGSVQSSRFTVSTWKGPRQFMGWVMLGAVWAWGGNKEVRESSSPWSLLLLFLGKPRVRSIRFAAGHDAEGSQSHVHFDEKLHDSVVMVTQESDNSFLVKVCELLPSISLTPPASLLACRNYLVHRTPSTAGLIGTSCA